MVTLYRSGEVALTTLPARGQVRALSIKTKRRAWLNDVVVLSTLEARQVALAILRATFLEPEAAL
jgi:hypothetical protein